MKQIKIFALLLVTFAALISCKKDEEQQVPPTLANSVWSNAVDANYEQTIVEFTDAENAIYSVIKTEDGDNKLKVRVEYRYTYKHPDITLMPKTLVDHMLEGLVIKSTETTEYMRLLSNVDSLELYLTKMDIE